MADGKVWTKETVDILVGFTYERIKAKLPGWLKLLGIVKPVLRIALNMLNKYADKVIPDEVDVYINSGILKIKDGDYKGASDDFATAENTLVDIPFLDEQNEQKAFANVNMAIIEFCKGLIRDK